MVEAGNSSFIETILKGLFSWFLKDRARRDIAREVFWIKVTLSGSVFKSSARFAHRVLNLLRSSIQFISPLKWSLRYSSWMASKTGTGRGDMAALWK
jgi:hypothetical protein